MATFSGDSDPNSFTGGGEDDIAHGNGGNDTLSGNGGNDILAGNGDSDILDGGDNDDWLYSADQSPPFTLPVFDEFDGPYTAPVLDTGTAVDTLRGGAGDDRLFAGHGDNVDGGADMFTGDYLYISFLGASAGIVFDFRLATQTIGGGTIANVENLAWLQGSNFNDDFNLGGPTPGSSDRTIVFAMAGNDRIVAGRHTGFIDGGDGNDLIDGRLSDQLVSVRGGAGDDILYDSALRLGEVLGGDGDDRIYAHSRVEGGDGNDTIVILGTAVPFVYGGAGNDDITGNDRGGYIFAGAGSDVVRGGAGHDHINAGASSDLTSDFDSGAERDMVTAGGGNDVVSVGHGDDADGGTGYDKLILSLAGHAGPNPGITLNTADLVSGQPYVLGGGTIQNFEAIEHLRGTAFDDVLNIATQAGNANFSGTTTVEGGSGNDQVRAHGSQVLFHGGAGMDTFHSGTAGDLFDGGEGVDTADYGGYATGVTVTLTPPPGAFQGRGPDGDILNQVENVAGSNFADSLTGDGGANVLTGRAGNDTLVGHGGDDTLDGGSGADSMRGGSGNDIYYVDDSGDTVEENSGEGTDRVYTSLAAYSLAGTNLEEVWANSNGPHDFRGNASDNVLAGGSGNDLFRVHDGGADTVYGGAGNDTIFFIDTLTPDDVVIGDDGLDTLVLQGHYAGGILLGAMVLVDNISFLGGGNTAFGEPGTNRYDYTLWTRDSNFAAGTQVRINAAALLAGEDFHFDGSAETGAHFVVYGGKGVDTLIGGHGNDIFFFAEDRFAPGDTVRGGPGGYDGLFLRGNYTIDFNAPGYHGLLAGIENMTLTSASDERYARGGGTEFDYDIKLADSHLDAGVALTVSGNLLQAGETMVLDGSLELDGILNIFGGRAADILKGGGQADILHGNLGADLLAGNGGADIFRYDAVAESGGSGLDHIVDFTPNTDRIDLSRIDASTVEPGNQDFRWIRSDAFSNNPGELRARHVSGADWMLEGDTNGDGIADLVIHLTLQGSTPIGAGPDFIL
ncbi:MAG TPA: calcium-binding protein [Allosphingosinicella sp.]|nr:calcium-binding protein [Allosphingosinicella sp.]